MSGIRAARRIVQAAQQVLRLAAQVVKHLVKQSVEHPVKHLVEVAVVPMLRLTRILRLHTRPRLNILWRLWHRRL